MLVCPYSYVRILFEEGSKIILQVPTLIITHMLTFKPTSRLTFSYQLLFMTKKNCSRIYLLVKLRNI